MMYDACMKIQTKKEMMKYGADEKEIDAALALYELLKPCLKVGKTGSNNHFELSTGNKSLLGLYRTLKDHFSS